jgi:carbon storage regulator CsrA
MLVLRRRAGESLLIGDDVEIEILAITAQGAKIGIRPPPADGGIAQRTENYRGTE